MSPTKQFNLVSLLLTRRPPTQPSKQGHLDADYHQHLCRGHCLRHAGFLPAHCQGHAPCARALCRRWWVRRMNWARRTRKSRINTPNARHHRSPISPSASPISFLLYWLRIICLSSPVCASGTLRQARQWNALSQKVALTRSLTRCQSLRRIIKALFCLFSRVFHPPAHLTEMISFAQAW